MRDNVKIMCRIYSLSNSTFGEMSSQSLVWFASSRWKVQEPHSHQTLRMLGFDTRLLAAAPKDTQNELVWLLPAGAQQVNGVQVGQVHPHRTNGFLWVLGCALAGTAHPTEHCKLGSAFKEHREKKNVSWDSLNHTSQYIQWQNC